MRVGLISILFSVLAMPASVFALDDATYSGLLCNQSSFGTTYTTSCPINKKNPVSKISARITASVFTGSQSVSCNIVHLHNDGYQPYLNYYLSDPKVFTVVANNYTRKPVTSPPMEMTNDVNPALNLNRPIFSFKEFPAYIQCTSAGYITIVGYRVLQE